MKLFGIKKTEYHYFDNDFDEFDFFNVYSGDDSLKYVGIKKVDKNIAERICDADLGSDFNDISARDQAERIVDVAIDHGWYYDKYFEWVKITKGILDIFFFSAEDAKNMLRLTD